ncbi:hypothetical protein [Nostoc sp. FACHB-133]|uniref:hypothetical protein n=1 Tax=Nostoc sp. FACHB-133 TaxID=2692835 RepID=UPI00168855DE|nr:hypothetical protein [Nostoc sp. FACHB-133]MBD2527452.1 hypothetical protein [Nostoc sp. FACHB-133]
MSKKIKELDSNDYHVAELVARGATEAEILSVYGKSRSSLQRLKAREDFQLLVQEAKANLKIAIAEVSYVSNREQHLQKLERFRENREKLGMELVKTGLKLLKLINQRLENAEANDLSPNQIPSHLKGVCMAFDSGFNMTAQALGIERMLEIFNQIEIEE